MRCFSVLILSALLCALLIMSLSAACLGLESESPWFESLSMELKAPPPVRSNALGIVKQRPRTYEGEYLEHVRMPIGGIGTGSIWLDEMGRLSIWQIFNNYTEVRIPHSFFALRVARKGEEPKARILQTVGEYGLEPMESLAYEGGYPIARLVFNDLALPVDVMLEGFNPMIPLDTVNSSIPAAIFRITVTNREERSIDVSLLGTLQNAVGSRGGYDIEGTRSPYYRKNRNTFERSDVGTLAHMRREGKLAYPGLVFVRNDAGNMITGPELSWIDRMRDPLKMNPEELEFLKIAGFVGGKDSGMVIAGTDLSFWQAVNDARKRTGLWKFTLFEDFEGDSYDGWTVVGEAFGSGPAKGSFPGQQAVTGFKGKGLVNTFNPNDFPFGSMRSREFVIENDYISFLIGGGNHPGITCINLLVDGESVRSATGKNDERLEPHWWDVSEYRGKKAVIEILDWNSGGWGHINIDNIVFGDVPVTDLQDAFENFISNLPMEFKSAERVESQSPLRVKLTRQGEAILGDLFAAAGSKRKKNSSAGRPWHLDGYIRFKGMELDRNAVVLAETESGDPILIDISTGGSKRYVNLASGMELEMAERLLEQGWGRPLGKDERFVSGSQGYGSMALLVDSPAGGTAKWTDPGSLIGEFVKYGRVEGLEDSGPSPDGETYNAALSLSFRLEPGESRTVTYAVAWHYPNVARFGHPGNIYNRRFSDAGEVARYVLDNLPRLWGWTESYHTAVYQSNLPWAILDAFTSQSVIFRSPTVFWAEDGCFGGYEGSYESCPLNCTHVWNYAQSHARFFPEIGRNMRYSDLLRHMSPEGEVSHRQYWWFEAFVDGQCASITAAYREHQLSPDKGFLERVWPSAKKAMDWLIGRYDSDRDGVLSGRQWNTYDTALSGASTFLGSQYLAALASAEKMAEAMGDLESAEGYGKIREKGSEAQSRLLWNGEYFIQLPDIPGTSDYGEGCHSDQLMGQWWASQLNLGHLYPEEYVKSALGAILKYNFCDDFIGVRQHPRKFAMEYDSGLLLCTWPHSLRPIPFIMYADEVWTGIEYYVAGLMMWEGMTEESVKIVEAARGRYDGRMREWLAYGPGGNPFNELECGKFYVRAMSSGGLLVAAQGLILDGPKGVIGFRPRWQPEDHRSFFTAPEGWGLFIQTRSGNEQRDVIEVRYGSLSLNELHLSVGDRSIGSISVSMDGKTVGFSTEIEGGDLRIIFDEPQRAFERVEAVININ